MQYFFFQPSNPGTHNELPDSLPLQNIMAMSLFKILFKAWKNKSWDSIQNSPI